MASNEGEPSGAAEDSPGNGGNPIEDEKMATSSGPGMDQALFFQGSTAEAIAAASGKKLLIVYIAGEEEATVSVESTTWTDQGLASYVTETCIALRVLHGSPDAGFFSAIYPVATTPTIAVIGLNGSRLKWLEGYVSAKDLQKHLEEANAVFQRQLREAAAAAAMAAVLFAAQPSRQTTPPVGPAPDQIPTPAPPAPVPATLSSSLPPPSQPTPSNPANTEAPSPPPPPKSVKQPKLEKPATDAPSSGATPQKVAPEKKATAPKKATAASQASAPPKAEKGKAARKGGGGAGPLPGTSQEAGAEPVPALAAPRREEEEGKVQVQFRLTDGRSVRGEFERGETLRAAREFVDRERTDGNGGYELATPFPRHTFTEAEMDLTLEQLGFASRTAIVLLPRGGPSGRAGPPGRPSAAPGGATPSAAADQAGGGGWSLTGIVGGALSYVNPLSIFRGRTPPAAAPSTAEAPPSGWEFDPNPALERQLRTHGGGMVAATGSNVMGGGAFGAGAMPSGGASTTGSKRLVGNVHTFRRDDDEDQNRRTNMFYNGNSTQFGGDGNDRGGS